MFSIFSYIMSRVTHSEPGLPMVSLYQFLRVVQTTAKNIQRCYTPKRIIRDLLSNDFFSQNSDLPRF